MTNLADNSSDWIFITPISGLELSHDIKEEFIVNRVRFVTREKLPRIRKKLGLPVTLSNLFEINLKNDKEFKKIVKDFFKSSKTFAVLPYHGIPKEKQKECIRIIKEELNILSLSQVGWSKRKFNKKLEIKTSEKGLIYKTIDINKHKKEFTHGLKTTYNPAPLILDKKWIAFHKRFFFFELIKIIRGESSMSKKWRTILHRASVMIGQSQNSSDLTFSLLWNVISLEMILTKEGEKISDKLVSRCEYFLGWNEDWKNEEYNLRIRDIYKKRCDFVHNGNIKLIEIKDILFTDDLIFNILNNIVKCKHNFQDIKDIFEYSEKYECEKFLNQKSKYQFGKFELMRKNYTENDYEEI